MDEETRQPRTEEDYMAMIVATLKVNTPQDAWQKVQELNKPRLVWLEGDKLAFASGIKIRAWQEIVQHIATMIDETVIR